MGLDRRLTASVAIAIAALAATAGCRARRGDEAPVEKGRGVDPAPPPPPEVDRALPGELAEGTLRAFGLLLPRVMSVSARFDDVVFASGDAPADQVANYVRQRISADRVDTGPEKTVFSRAMVRGQPGAFVTIMVVSRGNKSDLEIRDVTPKPAKEGLDSDARWRELGLRPDGTPLDPTRLR